MTRFARLWREGRASLAMTWVPGVTADGQRVTYFCRVDLVDLVDIVDLLGVCAR
jgi:hypothetical protein